MAVLGALGDLVLSLSADTARFQSDLGRGQRIADKFSKEVGRSLGNLAGLIGIAFSGHAIKDWIGGQIDAADAVGKLSQKVGISTEALSSYMVAAKLSNVSNEQLQVGLQQLAKNQADFVNGTGEAADAFRALGISEEQVKSLHGDTAKLFELISGKLAGFEDGANKTAIAMKIFGKSGAELIPMINSLDQARGEAEALGAVIDKDTAAAAERFNDNMTRVGVATQAAGLSIAKALLPTLEKLSERMVATAKDTEGMEKAGEVASTALKLLASGGVIVTTIFQTVGQTLGGFGAILWNLVNGRFREAWNVSGQIAMDWTKNVGGAVTSVEQIWDTTADRVKNKSPETGKKLAAPALVAADQAANASKAMAAAIMDVYNDAIHWVESGQEIEKQAADERQKYIEQWSKGMDDMDTKIEKQKSLTEELGLTFTSAFEDALVKGGDFRAMLQGLAQDLLRILVRKEITEPLGQALLGQLSGVQSPAQMAAYESAGAYTGNLPAFAEGTDYVPRTGLALIHQGEKIIPAGENRSSMGPQTSVTVHQTITLAAGVTEPQLVAAMLRAKEAAKSEIEQSVQRGSRRFVRP